MPLLAEEFRKFCEQYREKLVRDARYGSPAHGIPRLGNAADAQDAAHDAVLEAMQKLDTYDETQDSGILAWVRGFLKHTAKRCRWGRGKGERDRAQLEAHTFSCGRRVECDEVRKTQVRQTIPSTMNVWEAPDQERIWRAFMALETCLEEEEKYLRETVERYLGGESVVSIAKDLGMPQRTLQTQVDGVFAETRRKLQEEDDR